MKDTDLKDLTFFLSPDFHELWHSMMSSSLITVVKQQWATLVLALVKDSDGFAACTCRLKPLLTLLSKRPNLVR